MNPIVFVKLPGAVVKGVDEQCAHAGVLCHRHDTIDGILHMEEPSCLPWARRSTASRARTSTGMGSGMLRRTWLAANWCETAPAAMA